VLWALPRMTLNIYCTLKPDSIKIKNVLSTGIKTTVVGLYVVRAERERENYCNNYIGVYIIMRKTHYKGSAEVIFQIFSNSLQYLNTYLLPIFMRGERLVRCIYKYLNKKLLGFENFSGLVYRTVSF